MKTEVESALDIVMKTILAEIRPVSVFLTGSFGRGEGSILFEEGRKKLLRDMDILVVVRRRVNSSTILSINKMVNKKIEFSNSPQGNAYPQFVNVSQIPLGELLFWNDLKAYDLKHASKLLWGEDIRDRIAVRNADEITLFSAMRPLLNKYIGLCLYSPLKCDSNIENTAAALERIMEYGKTYVEIGTSACIIDRKYAPSYKLRMNIIDHEIRWLPATLKERILTFTKLKLNPSSHKDLFSLNADELWFETREALNSFFLEIYREAYGLRWADDWKLYVKLWIQRMNTQALSPHFDFYLRRRWGISSLYLSHLLNFVYQNYFSYHVLKETRFKGARALMLQTNPLFEVYGLAILLVNSIYGDSTINRDYILSFIERQKKLPSIGEKSEDTRSLEGLNDASLFTLCVKLLSSTWSAVNRAFYGTNE